MEKSKDLFDEIESSNPFSNIKNKEESKQYANPQVRELLEHEKILQEFGGLESNIPVNHPRYWKVRP